MNIFYSGEGDFAQKHWTYPPATLENPSSQRFSVEGGTDEKGNRIDFIRNDQGADKQFEFFMPNGPLMGFLKQEWQDSINQLKHLFIAFLEHKSTSDHQSLVNLEVQRKLRENFSSCLDHRICLVHTNVTDYMNHSANTHYSINMDILLTVLDVFVMVSCENLLEHELIIFFFGELFHLFSSCVCVIKYCYNCMFNP